MKNGHLFDSCLERCVSSALYTQPGALGVIERVYKALDNLIVSRAGRSRGRGRPLDQYVVKWKLMRVCWADFLELRAYEKVNNI